MDNAAEGSTHASGGGLYNCILRGCLVIRNRSIMDGGAASCELYNCSIVNNTVSSYGGWDRSGGVIFCRLVNCIVTGNRKPGRDDN